MARALSCDVLGEVRKAMRALRRAEQYLAKKERAERKAGRALGERFRVTQQGNEQLRQRDEAELLSQG